MRCVLAPTLPQDYIISYCRPTNFNADESRAAHGEIHVSHILTGRCVARLSGTASDARGGSGSGSSSDDDSAVATTVGVDNLFGSASDDDDVLTEHSAGDQGGTPLGEVSALHFSEERNELFVGNRHGMLYVFGQ